MYAVFFETESTTDYSKTPQYLVFPISKFDGYAIFRRESDGGKGGTNRWSNMTSIPLDESLVVEPTTVLVTPADITQYVNTGMPSTLTSKAMRAHEKSEATTTTTSSPDIQGIPALVASASPELNKWMRDGRRVRPVVAAPVYQQVQYMPMPTVTAVMPEVVEDRDLRMAFVPERKDFAHYVHRSIGGQRDFDIFHWARTSSRNVLLYGPTGPGKTTCALAYAAQEGMRVAMVSGSAALEPAHYLGREFIGANGIPFWQDGIVTDVVRNGGMIILDEAGFIPSKIITPLFPLLQYGTRHLTLLEHKGETIKAHPDLLIVATMNPHYAGNQSLNEALRNRYTIQLEWGYDDAVERQLIPFKSLRDLAKAIRDREAREEISTPTPTNALTEFVEIAAGLGMEFARINFINRYEDDEKEAVKLAFDAARDNIIADLAGLTAEVNETAETAQSFIHDLANLDLNI